MAKVLSIASLLAVVAVGLAWRWVRRVGDGPVQPAVWIISGVAGVLWFVTACVLVWRWFRTDPRSEPNGSINRR